MIGIEGDLMKAGKAPEKKKSRQNWRLSEVNREASNRGGETALKSPANRTVTKLTLRS
jgi:hypothetical protein